MSQFLSYLQLPFVLLCIFSIQVMGLQLVLGGTGLLSLGQACFYTVGGYLSAMFTVFIAPKLGISNPYTLLFLASLVGVFSATFLALLVAIPCLKLREDYLAMATLGVGQITQTVFNNLDFVGGTRGFNNIPKLTSTLIIFVVTVLVALFLFRFYKTHLGFAVRAVRDDEISARSFGVPIYKTKLVSFLIGSGLAGLAGAFSAHTLQFISPDDSAFYNSVVLVLAVVIGGMYSIWGSLLGAFVIFVIPEFLKFLPQVTDPYLQILAQKQLLSPQFIAIVENILSNRTLIFALLVIIIMLLNPKGIVGFFDRFQRRRPA